MSENWVKNGVMMEITVGNFIEVFQGETNLIMMVLLIQTWYFITKPWSLPYSPNATWFLEDAPRQLPQKPLREFPQVNQKNHFLLNSLCNLLILPLKKKQIKWKTVSPGKVDWKIKFCLRKINFHFKIEKSAFQDTLYLCLLYFKFSFLYL